MTYTRQQGARDTRSYLAAIVAYLQDTVGEEHADAYSLWQACDRYAMEQRKEWPCETELRTHTRCRGTGCECDGAEAQLPRAS